MVPVPMDDATVAIRTPAKLNLFLEVVGKRPDGFHELDMIMEAIDLCDTLTFTRTKTNGITLSCQREDIPTGPENTICRAAALFFQACDIPPAVHCDLTKSIPSGGGLGGASGNAIGALFALEHLFNVTLPEDILFKMACQLGSDMPFFMKGGIARCQGRGEIVSPLGPAASRRFLLVIPSFSLSTAKVYDHLIFPLTFPKQLGNMYSKVVEDQIADGRLFFNRLEASAFSLQPQLQAIVKQAHMEGVSLTLTGSGSCLFSTVSEGAATRTFDNLKNAWPGVAKVTLVENLNAWR